MPQPWEKYQTQGETGPWSKYAPPKEALVGAQAPLVPQTLQQRAQETFGFKEYERRGTLLPFGRTKEGKTELALPQVFVDMAESALLPGHVAQGGQYSPEDALRFTLDYLIPATTQRGAKPPTKKDIIKTAPTGEQLKKQAKAFKTAATGSGVSVDPDDYVNMMSRMETMIQKERINPTLHPKASAVFDVLSKQVGQDIDVEDLMIARRIIGVAQRSVSPELADERRIAGMMEDVLDDFVDNLGGEVGSNLSRFRNLWHRAKKSEIVEDVIEKAGRQASGFENGIRIGMRRLLNSKKQIRGFSPDEVKMIKDIEAGTTGQKLMRLLGKLAYGKRGGESFLGGAIGSAAGGAVGSSFGPLGAGIGAVVPPVVGQAAQKGAEKTAARNAELLRALIASGAQRPARGQNILDLLIKAAPPVVGTEVQRPDPRFLPPYGA